MTAPAVPGGMKRCTKCGEIKPFSEFHRDARTKDGLMCQCKACRHKYHEQNREKTIEYNRKYHEQNREKTIEYNHKYYEQNQDKMIERVKKYNACVKHPSCPLVGGRGAEFITFVCEVCGTEFRRRKTKVDYDYERRGNIPRFCSNECKNAANRKNYKSPYARKIEDIKKRLKN